MRYTLTRNNLSKGLAVILAGTMFFNGMKGCERHLKKHTGTPNTNSYSELETGDLNVFLKTKCNILAKKHFKETEIKNIVIESVKTECYNNPISISIRNINNKGALKKFIIELQSFSTIYSLTINNQILATLKDIDFKDVENLEVESASTFIGLVDLNNFSNIKDLTLKRVNATNIPSTIKSIRFYGENNFQYCVNSELNELSNNENLSNIEFYNLSSHDFVTPKSKNLNIYFFNCDGVTKINILETDNVNINIKSNDTYKNCVIVNGKINKELNIISNSNNVFTGSLDGEPKSTITIRWPEGDYIREPLNSSYLENLKLTRKK